MKMGNKFISIRIICLQTCANLYICGYFKPYKGFSSSVTTTQIHVLI